MPHGHKTPGPYDFSISLHSLTKLYGPYEPEAVTTILKLLDNGALWRGPYIRVPSEKVKEWRTRLINQAPSGLRIGVCWASQDPARQLPFAAVREHLLGVPGVHWFSLQRGPHAVDADGTEIVNIEDEHGTILDVAAIIANLDLFISCDTMIPHLAGALGTPVWLVLNLRCNEYGGYDGRWLDRDDVPMYPSMRIFRQQVKDDWSVLQSTREQLYNFLGTKGNDD